MLNETIHNYAHCSSTWYLALFSMFFICWSYTVLLIFRSRPKPSKPSQAVPIRPKLSQNSRNVVWWSTQHPHPAWQRFRQIRRPEHNTKQIEETWGNRWTKICERPGKIKPLVKKREELYEWVSEATAPSTLRLALVVTRPCRSPGGFALQNAKSKITTTWSSRTRRVMATDAVRQTSSNRFTQPLVRHCIPIRWDGKQYVKVAHLNTVSQWFSMILNDSQCISEIGLTTCSQMVEMCTHFCLFFLNLINVQVTW